MFGTFGNKVRIKNSPETEEKGLAGKLGEILGETTPSLMDLQVIGSPKGDYAINVHFEDGNESFWFDPELLEHVDDGEGAEITLDGIDTKWIKGKNGEWIEVNTSSFNSGTESRSKSSDKRPGQKNWWKFWKKQ